MISKVSSSAETQEPEIDFRVVELVSIPSSRLCKKRAKSLVNSLNLTSSIGFKPRPLIMFFTLKLVFDTYHEPLVKFAFGLVRGLYKEVIRSSSPVIPKERRRSYRHSRIPEMENFEIIDVAKETEELSDKRIFRKNTSESPSFFDKSSDSWHLEKNSKKQVLRSISKIFLKFLDKCFQKFKQNQNRTQSKKNALKNFVGILTAKLFRPVYNSLLKRSAVQKLKEDSKTDSKFSITRSVSVNSQGLNQRRLSFELKDKELWRKRHPIRKHSPSPIQTRFSLVPNAENVSPILPRFRKSLIKNSPRRNTVGVLKKFDTFGTGSEGKKEDSQEMSEVSEEPKAALVKQKKNVLRSQKDEKNGVKRRKSDIFVSQPLAKVKKIENMVKVLGENLDMAKGKGIVKLHQHMQTQKKLQKENAVKELIDSLSYQRIKFEKSGKKSGFDGIKTESAIKNSPAHIERPEKKTGLRSSPAKHAPDTDRSKKILTFLDFAHTHSLKNKLLAFLSIIEASDTPQKPVLRPECKSALRSLFRVIETNKFLKLCRTFHSLKIKSAQLHKQKQKRSLPLCQKLTKTFQIHQIFHKKSAFSALLSTFRRSKANSKLVKTLSKIETRIKLLIKPIVWYSISSFIKKYFYSSKIRSMKVEFLFRKIQIRKLAAAFVRWENFWQRVRNVKTRTSSGKCRTRMYSTTSGAFSRGASPVCSPSVVKLNYRSPSGSRVLPQPKDIHDYIDDLFEVGKAQIDTFYLPRSPASLPRKRFTWTK